MRLFVKFPWLFILLGLILVANNILKFAPAQVLHAPFNIIVPLLMIAIGVGFYTIPFLKNKGNR